MSYFKLLPTILVKYMLRSVHGIISILFNVNAEKIVFASYRDSEFKDNLYYVSKEIEEKYSNYKRVYLLKKFDSSIPGKISYVLHLIKACFHLATSRYFFIDDYYFPVYVIKPRKQVKIIQLWHSSGAFKQFGLSTVGKPFGPSHRYLEHVKVHGNYSVTYVSSKNVISCFAEAFGMPEELIKPLGVPRTDYFFQGNLHSFAKEKLIERYPKLRGKKLILYAPTYRGKSHSQEHFQLPFNLSNMERNLENEYALLIHLHPYMRSELEIIHNHNFVFHIKHDFTIQELLGVTDILITDYSTVFFDFSLLNRPIVFFADDLNSYIKERDFYYDYEQLIPGPLVSDTESLIKVIREEDFSQYKIKEFANRFFDYQDGKATERVVRDILNE